MALSKNDLLALIDLRFPDNANEEITAFGARDVLGQMVDSDLNLLESSENPYISNRKIINSAADWPAEVGGFIPLSPNTEYYIGAANIPATKFSLSGPTVFNGRPYVSSITSTTGGDLFTGTDLGALIISGVSFDAPTATLLNISDTTPNTIVNLQSVTGSLQSLGTYSDIIGLTMELMSVGGLLDGITDIGSTTSVLSINRVGLSSLSAAFKAIDLGANVYSSLEISNLRISAPIGAFGISGLIDSGNVAVGQVATVKSCEFLGGMTPLENITRDDVRFMFNGNGSIADTYPDALLSLSGNTTETVISTTNTPVRISGTWINQQSSQFLSEATGRATYLGETPIQVPITATVSLEPVSGTNRVLTAYIAINGVAQPASGIQVTADSGAGRTLTLVWQKQLTYLDYVEAFVENNSNTTNILVRDAVERLR